MTQLSIVVACFERTELLEESLVAVLQQRPRDCEVLVVHDGRYQDPYELTDEVEYVLVAPGSGWVEAIEAGWRASRGKVVHVLGAGVLPQSGWTDAALAEFRDPAVGSVIPLVEDAGNAGRIRCVGVGVGACLGRRLVGAGRTSEQTNFNRLRPLGPNLAASFFRREALQQVGGLDDRFGDDLSDIDLARRLDEAGYETAIVPNCRLTAGAFDQPRNRRAAAQGRGHQRLIRSWSALPAWRKTLAAWWQVAIELVTAPRAPRRLASVWGRLSEMRTASPVAATTSAVPVISLAEHQKRKPQAQEANYEESAPRRRAA